MNAMTSFDQLRPADEHLDTAATERIWNEIIAAHPGGFRARTGSEDMERVERDRSTPLVIVRAAEQPSRRRFALIGTAAVVLLGVAGFAAIQVARDSTSTFPATDQPSESDVSTSDALPVASAVAGDSKSVIGLALPTLPDGLALVGATQPTVRLEPSPYQDRLYGALGDPADPTRMIRVEYARSQGIAIPCHSFLSLSMPDGARAYSAAEWMDAATPIDGSTPFAVGGAVGSYCTNPNGLIQAGWFAGNIGVDLLAGTAVTTTELVDFAQSLTQVAPSEPLQSRPPVDLVSDPLPVGWTVLVGEDVPFTQHVTETSWVASVGGVAGAGQLVVQSWIGADEQGVYAKHAPVEAKRITIRGHDGYRFSAQRGADGPLEIQIWWTEAPGVVISVWATDLFDVDALTTLIEQMTPVDATGYSTFVGSVTNSTSNDSGINPGLPG